MAKKKKCTSTRCVCCRWWPKVCRHLGAEGGCYWVDKGTGELMIATGLRALPCGDYIPITGGPDFYECKCDCGNSGPVRADLLHRGTVDRCPQCAADAAQTARN